MAAVGIHTAAEEAVRRRSTAEGAAVRHKGTEREEAGEAERMAAAVEARRTVAAEEVGEAQRAGPGATGRGAAAAAALRAVAAMGPSLHRIRRRRPPRLPPSCRSCRRTWP